MALFAAHISLRNKAPQSLTLPSSTPSPAAKPSTDSCLMHKLMLQQRSPQAFLGLIQTTPQRRQTTTTFTTILTNALEPSSPRLQATLYLRATRRRA
jgi:hypothetical protein